MGKRRIREHPFLRRVVTLAGSTALGQVALLLAAPALTRLYTPDDIGRFALWTAFIGFITVGVSLRYELAIVAAPDDHEAAQLTIIAIGLSFGMAVLFALVCAVCIRLNWFGMGALSLWAAFLTFPACMLIGVFTVVRYWLVRQSGFRLIGRATVVQNVVRAVAPVLLGIIGSGWLGLILGDIIGRGFGIRALFQRSVAALRAAMPQVQTRLIRGVLHSYRAFPLYGLPSALLNGLALALPLLLIGQIYGVQAAGWFGLVQRVIALPLSLVGTSVADVFHGQVAEHQRRDVSAMHGLFFRTAGGLLLVGLVPTAILMAGGAALFGWAFGAEWHPAGQLAALMAPWFLAQLVVSPLSRIVFVTGGQRAKLVYDLTSLVIVLATLSSAQTLQLPLETAVAWLSGLSIAAYSVYFGILVRNLPERHTERTAR